MLRGLFGGQGEELMGSWMNVHNEELLDTNSSNITWEIKSKGNIAAHGTTKRGGGGWWWWHREITYSVLVEQPE